MLSFAPFFLRGVVVSRYYYDCGGFFFFLFLFDTIPTHLSSLVYTPCCISVHHTQVLVPVEALLGKFVVYIHTHHRPGCFICLPTCLPASLLALRFLRTYACCCSHHVFVLIPPSTRMLISIDVCGIHHSTYPRRLGHLFDYIDTDIPCLRGPVSYNC